MIRFSKFAGYLRLFFFFVYVLPYMFGFVVILLRVIGFNVSHDMVLAGIWFILFGVSIQFIIQELIILLFHKLGKSGFTEQQLIIGGEKYDLNKVDIYYYKPSFINSFIVLPCAGLMKIDIHEDVFIHGSITGKEIGFFSMREVKRIIKTTGVNIHIM